MPFPFAAVGAGVGIGSSLLGGIFGSRDARKAQRKQEALINEARGLYGQQRSTLQGAQDAALLSIDEANMILAGIEPAVLAGMDESLRVAFANQLRQQEMDQARLQSQMASAGLDMTTAGIGAQRGLRFGQAQQLGQVGAAYAGQRGNLIAGARAGVAAGLNNRAQTLGMFGSQIAGSYGQEANFLGGIQVQPANTGAGIGALGGQISNMLFNQELMGLLQGDPGGGTGLLPGQMGPPIPPGYQF